MPGVGFTVYKARLPNRDAQRGKSGGYRVIYFVKTSERVVLIEMYSKSDQDLISNDEIVAIINEIDTE